MIEYSSAFLQLYREEGFYLERTVHFVARVGLDYVVRRVVEDAASRRALADRLMYAVSLEADPWHEPAKAQVDARQFIPIRAEVPA